MENRVVLSSSAVLTFLNNPIQFKKRYIAKVYDEPMSPTAVVGKAVHKLLECHFSGKTFEESLQEGLATINNISDYEIEYGKTGSRENILNDYERLSQTVMKEIPQIENVLAVEARIEATVSLLNKKIPVKGFIDLVEDNGDSLTLWDWKTVYAYSDEDKENAKYLIQAWFYTHLAEFEYKKPVKAFKFCEIKRSINRNGDPQIKMYVLDREAVAQSDDVVGRLVKQISDCVDNPNYVYFPNPNDIFDKGQSLDIYAQMDGVAIRTVHTTERREKYAPVNTVVAEDTAKEGGSDVEKIMAKLAEFGIGGKYEKTIEANQVNTYIIKPNRGVRMAKFAQLEDDISLALGSEPARVIAPIYGTTTVGIEVPKTQEFPVWDGENNGLIPIGVDTMNQVVYDDIAKMPHMLVGGQTGSGKSVFIRNLIMSLKDCDITVVDCKMMDFMDLDGKLCSVITETHDAEREVKALVELMNDRYRHKETNAKRKVLIIDEYADLIMGLGKEKVFNENTGKYETIDHKAEFETNLCRLLQKSRAANINVIIATQRPSADIVAPIIKANCPVKACMRVATARNSEIILDQAGGERLLGKGDMLYLGSGKVNPVRLQCFAPIERKA